MGNCVYHSACCETIDVISTASGQLTGKYGRIYVEHLPYVVYKKLYTEGQGCYANDFYTENARKMLKIEKTFARKNVLKKFEQKKRGNPVEGDETNRYIHYHTGQDVWVISDKYWTENNQQVFVYSKDKAYDCPNQMRYIYIMRAYFFIAKFLYNF